MRESLSIRLSAAEQTMVTRWSLALLGSVLLIALCLIAWAVFTATSPLEVSARRVSESPATCASWDEAAREAVVALVREPGDLALRQVGDVVFRLRRARRNCAHGWVRLACQDYNAIIRVNQATADPLPATSAVCWTALRD